MTSKISESSSHAAFIHVPVKKVKYLRMSPENILEFDEWSPLSICEKRKHNIMKNEAR